MILYYNYKNKNFARDNRNQYLMVKHEWIFWNMVLRKDMTWFRFLRQKIIWNYIIDFYCHKLKLWIEIDWESHDRQWKYDEDRENIWTTYE